MREQSLPLRDVLAGGVAIQIDQRAVVEDLVPGAAWEDRLVEHEEDVVRDAFDDGTAPEGLVAEGGAHRTLGYDAFERRVVGHRDGPLGVPDVRSALHADLAIGPRLPDQPFQTGLAVGRFVDHRIPGALGSIGGIPVDGPAYRLEDHRIPARDVVPVFEDQIADPVRRANEDGRKGAFRVPRQVHERGQAAAVAHGHHGAFGEVVAVAGGGDVRLLPAGDRGECLVAAADQDDVGPDVDTGNQVIGLVDHQIDREAAVPMGPAGDPDGPAGHDGFLLGLAVVDRGGIGPGHGGGVSPRNLLEPGQFERQLADPAREQEGRIGGCRGARPGGRRRPGSRFRVSFPDAVPAWAQGQFSRVDAFGIDIEGPDFLGGDRTRRPEQQDGQAENGQARTHTGIAPCCDRGLATISQTGPPGEGAAGPPVAGKAVACKG